jgi:hypothetical protein
MLIKQNFTDQQMSLIEFHYGGEEKKNHISIV